LLPQAVGTRFLWVKNNNSTQSRAIGRIGEQYDPGLTIEQFDEKAVNLMRRYSVPGEPGHCVTIGTERVITVGKNYPTMPGIADLHFHGSLDGSFYQVFEYTTEQVVNGILTKVTKTYKVKLSAEDIAAYLKSEFPNIRGVRLFVCYGAEAGAQRIHEILGIPVLTSKGAPIAVTELGSQKGKMEMLGGTLVIFE
jgi:hypothetical protein